MIARPTSPVERFSSAHAIRYSEKKNCVISGNQVVEPSHWCSLIRTKLHLSDTVVLLLLGKLQSERKLMANG